MNDCLELHGDFFDGVFNIGEILHFEHWRLHVAKLLKWESLAAPIAFLCFKLSFGLPTIT